MSYAFHPDAEIEFNHAIDYYEDIDKNLGYDFSLEIYMAIERAIAHPGAWPVIENEIRRSLVRRFPYGILYFEDTVTGEIFILAVMHLHRDPDYWKKRINR